MTLVISTIRLIMMAFQHCNKIKKSKTPCICFRNPWEFADLTLRTSYLKVLWMTKGFHMCANTHLISYRKGTWLKAWDGEEIKHNIELCKVWVCLFCYCYFIWSFVEAHSCLVVCSFASHLQLWGLGSHLLPVCMEVACSPSASGVSPSFLPSPKTCFVGWLAYPSFHVCEMCWRLSMLSLALWPHIP